MRSIVFSSLLVLFGSLLVAAEKPTSRPVDQAKVEAAKVDLSVLETALDAFEIDNGRWPTTAEGLASLLKRPQGLNSWRGPYIKRLPADPWGNPYQYRRPGVHSQAGYDLYSNGPEGREGSPGQIGNWQP